MRKSGSLGNIPLTVIRHGISEMFSGMPLDQAKQAEQVWQELQTDLAGLSTDNRLLVADKSGHNMLIDQPGLVVESIKQMVEIVREKNLP